MEGVAYFDPMAVHNTYEVERAFGRLLLSFTDPFPDLF